MNSYEFKYKKQFSGMDAFGKADVTAERKVAQLINSVWCYSMHWPQEINQDWLDVVKKDLETELAYAKQRVSDLELARKIIGKLEL